MEVNRCEFFQSFSQTSLEERKRLSDQVLSQYSERVPILVDKIHKSPLPNLVKNKFLVPSYITIGEFLHQIRNSISLGADQGLILFINEMIPPTSSIIGVIYEKYKNEDGFLYIAYTGENVFG